MTEEDAIEENQQKYEDFRCIEHFDAKQEVEH
jgi:hypothetical protein